MKGLLIKDWIVAKRNCRALLMMALIFACVSFVQQDFMLFLLYPCVFAGLLPMTLYSYDEMEKWHCYCETLPVTRAQYVSGKFLTGLISSAAALLLMGCCKAIQLMMAGYFSLPEYLLLLSAMATAALIAPAIMMPIIFKFGMQKGRIVYYFVIGGIAACSVLMNFDSLDTTAIDSGISGIAVFAAAALLYCISWLISIRFYQKKEF